MEREVQIKLSEIRNKKNKLTHPTQRKSVAESFKWYHELTSHMIILTNRNTAKTDKLSSCLYDAFIMHYTIMRGQLHVHMIYINTLVIIW